MTLSIHIDIIENIMTEREMKSLAVQLSLCIHKLKGYGNVELNIQNIELIKNFLPNNFIRWPVNFDKLNEKTIIILSADGDEELEEIRDDEVYYIGGLVDKNRKKNFFKERYKNYTVKKLNIKRHIKLKGSPVLSTSTVFNILVDFYELKDWKRAYENNLPKRKF